MKTQIIIAALMLIVISACRKQTQSPEEITRAALVERLAHQPDYVIEDLALLGIGDEEVAQKAIIDKAGFLHGFMLNDMDEILTDKQRFMLINYLYGEPTDLVLADGTVLSYSSDGYPGAPWAAMNQKPPHWVTYMEKVWVTGTETCTSMPNATCRVKVIP